MRVEVTQEDIDRGLQGTCYSCPVALAVARAAGIAVVFVSEKECVIGEGKPKALSYAVRDFILAFDRGGPVLPFSFEL